jgi:hypothetical protein
MSKGWYQIMWAVLTAMALGVLGFSGNWVHKTYAEHSEAVTTIRGHMVDEVSQQQVQKENAVLLKQIARDIGDVKMMTMTVMGLAKVQGDGGDEASVLVNVNGRAMMYKSEQRVRVTNMQSQEQESVLVKINGTFSMPDENKLLMLSKKAGAMLSLQPNQVVRVKLEPVVEKQ